jgi:hypothetical protein
VQNKQIPNRKEQSISQLSSLLRLELNNCYKVKITEPCYSYSSKLTQFYGRYQSSLTTIPLGKLMAIWFTLARYTLTIAPYKKPNKIVYMSYRLASLARIWCVNLLPHPDNLTCGLGWLAGGPWVKTLGQAKLHHLTRQSALCLLLFCVIIVTALALVRDHCYSHCLEVVQSSSAGHICTLSLVILFHPRDCPSPGYRPQLQHHSSDTAPRTQTQR